MLIGARLEVTQAVLASLAGLLHCDQPQLLIDAQSKPLRFLGLAISFGSEGMLWILVVPLHLNPGWTDMRRRRRFP